MCVYVCINPLYSLQGAGTAIGELPPYFMARAARLSGADLEDEDLKVCQKSYVAEIQRYLLNQSILSIVKLRHAQY